MNKVVWSVFSVAYVASFQRLKWKDSSSCLVSLCLCLNHKELKLKSYTWHSSGQSWKSQMRFGSHENNLWFYFLVSSLVAWCIFCHVKQNEMYSMIHKYKMSKDLKLGKTCSWPTQTRNHYLIAITKSMTIAYSSILVQSKIVQAVILPHVAK